MFLSAQEVNEYESYRDLKKLTPLLGSDKGLFAGRRYYSVPIELGIPG